MCIRDRDKPKVTHIDFQRVVAGEKLHANVQLHLINENKSQAIKSDGGHAEYLMNEVEITCLPKNLPEFIEVDMTDIEMGQTLHISDITLPKGVESVELAKGEDHDLAIVTIKAAKGPAVENDSDDSANEESGDTEE